ncbi:bifunctional ADP-dependent NAD(P)H-hydrate dehydratase/NAD(P)H-hydrate epimerase [Photobacterium angustum]|uniref:Bifunctional NAD(P)H-hydrate repair enzyme n=1 Tax=Photobacterium angustum TaxID=661 RepID=A0A855S6W9_PHOAN|nr:bifunctional ADP-dependent NAD(P)H-hydrate dehydratase/NAD(P)H-hydrate epimerase [Photobacterium angustum]KJF79846.1 NAD(P)H-hydrate epimerase [Photobacterium damselae subsp. damselae]KJG27717.1 NAD(P)H-hydrate epimerase [Photobacterium angustum]KJG37586.1 NAD(P)H-hydrate epimerase [Photobacterium angustum]KJG43330.1 NAD(P)H-hydrate epimerase [Photobacterium angustum]KJG45127.1 NAD(P)H-hydrate epimerase [Photobacterium angustum]
MITNDIPLLLYTSEQIRQGEQLLTEQQNSVTLYHLMERAGEATFDLMRQLYPQFKKLLVCCGKGNNGGDGYVVARLAHELGIDVTVWELPTVEHLPTDARCARSHWLQCNGKTITDTPTTTYELIIDALLGIGIKGQVRSEMADRIRWINHQMTPVIAVDVPSGLCADTGATFGAVIKASQTLSFIGFKQGLTTGQAAQYCGERYFSDLGVALQFSQVMKPSALHITESQVQSLLLPRSRVAHKGCFGRVLCIGGDLGMAGAIRLSSEACARAGAGLTSVITRPDNALSIVMMRPEIMAIGWQESSNILIDKLAWSDVVVLGPGLGTSDWGQSLFAQCHHVDKPCVVDADGLNLLAKAPDYRDNRIITPHPGEAARLLNVSIDEIEADRFAAIQRLQQNYGGVVVLKGAGSLIYDGKTLWICTCGNPGMATGGMGDVLSGIIGALLGQGLALVEAAYAGVWIHSRAADLCAQSGERGMLASDLFPFIRQLVNPR